MNNSYKNISDNELALMLRESYNPAIFNELLSRYEKKINHQCRILIKNEAVADDLSQEIMIKIFMKIKSYKAEAMFSTWVYSITHNTCLDFLRKNKKIQYQQLTTEITEAFQGEQDVEEGEQLDFTIENFDKMLDDMEPETRIIMILRYRQNCSVKEIMEQLHLSESAVKMRLLRAREKIKRHLLTKS